MSDRGFRLACLYGLLVIIVGAFLAGMPLIGVIIRDVYHQSSAFDLGGDYRGWRMAHLEGLMNGLLVLGVAASCRRGTMSRAVERTLVWTLAIGAWGNTLGATIAAATRQRGIALSGSIANNLVYALFFVALVASLAALILAVRHALAGAAE